MTSLSKRAGIWISMCGRGRCYDHILIERLWRSVKYEEVYLNEYANLRQARQRLGGYISFYNHRRPHQSLRYRTPSEVYHGHSGPHPAMAITHTTTTCPLGPTCPAIPTTLAVLYLKSSEILSNDWGTPPSTHRQLGGLLRSGPVSKPCSRGSSNFRKKVHHSWKRKPSAWPTSS